MRWFRAPKPGLAFFLASALVSAASAGCLENKDFYQNLPTSIGREDQVGKFPFALNCDTVFVRKGVTTVVHPGTMLYFSRPSINSVIKVEGTLILKGTRNSYVTLSGSLDSSKNGAEPGQKLWGGIEVAEGGRLEMEYVGCMRAPTPVTAFSPQVRIVNSWFKGSSGIILPDGSLYPMESSWHAINDLDLAKGTSDRKPAARPAESLSDSEKAALLKQDRDKRFWTWKKAGFGVAALAVVGVGAAYLLPKGSSPSDTSSGRGPKQKPDLRIDPLNAFPQP
jgi:hypothetical protein